MALVSAVENVLHAMRAYLADCAAQEIGGPDRAAELNDVICACIGTLAEHRRSERLASHGDERLDALGHAMRYIDESRSRQRKTLTKLRPFAYDSSIG